MFKIQLLTIEVYRIVLNEEQVIIGVEYWARWWVNQRKKKLEEQLNETMSVNPFILPFLFDYHDLKNFEELVGLIVASHLMIGHATGFGKLIDEKILPNVFGTKKLDAGFRKYVPFRSSCFDEIDHLIIRADGRRELLSLKAGKWTIQLTMAVQLNRSFHEMIVTHGNFFDTIMVGVFYGKKEDLTDKYDILCGENRGANHDVVDIRHRVNVVAGREFWMWLNDGEFRTQEWVLSGIVQAVKKERLHETAKSLIDSFAAGVSRKYVDNVDSDLTVNWNKILTKING
jgi:hypothetical protein